MLHGDALGLLVGAIILGAVHGIEPGHGWPVAATYALDQTNKWVYGFAASFILGVGHLVSSLAMVAVFFYAKGYFNLTQANEPLEIVGGIQIGGPVSIVAGVLLIALGIREYSHGHSHGHSESSEAGVETQSESPDTPAHRHDDESSHSLHGHGTEHGQRNEHDHGHGHEHSQGHGLNHEHGTSQGHGHSHGHDHSHEHDNGSVTLWSRLKEYIPFVGDHSHDHGDLDAAANRGLLGIAWFAFVLGFAHEEEFEIIGLCAGSNYCLELMSAYALTVIFGIVGLTMLLIAGYQHYEEKVEQYTPYLPVFSAAVLILMGFGFITGLF